MAQFAAARGTDNVVLLALPPYSPELHPVENMLRHYLRSNQLSNRLFADYAAIIQACRDAWNGLMELPQTIISIATRSWAQVKIQTHWYQQPHRETGQPLTGRPW